MLVGCFVSQIIRHLPFENLGDVVGGKILEVILTIHQLVFPQMSGDMDNIFEEALALSEKFANLAKLAGQSPYSTDAKSGFHSTRGIALIYSVPSLNLSCLC